MPLTDAKIRNTKPAAKPVKLTDGGGLYLLLNPSGSRLWRWKYRIACKEKLLALGAYPDVPLAKARQRRDEARSLLADGIDPSEHKRREEQESRVAANSTFRIIAEEYLEKLRKEERATATLEKTRWLLDFALARIGDRSVTEITAPEVLEVLRFVEVRGRHETARRLRSTISAVFRYAIATARAVNDPTFALRGALINVKVRHRPAVTDEDELGALLRAIDGFEGQPSTKAALRLLPILFPRPGELRAAEWNEFDLEKAVWTIPAERTKMRRPHKVPLPRQAIEILEGLQPLTGFGALVFPGTRSASRPISDNTLNAALRRLGYAKDEATAHGFRATVSTLLNESGKWNPDAIERQLAHVEENDVRRAYARGEHWAERVELMQWWADWLDDLRDGSRR